MQKKVLVIDDAESIRQMLKIFLEKRGYTVKTAESAEHAMEILKNDSIMVIFLDLNLPGLTGLEFCRKIRRENHIGFVFAMTGFVDLYNLIKCRNAGFDDFFTKPFALDMVLKTVEDAFEKLKRWRIDEYELD